MSSASVSVSAIVRNITTKNKLDITYNILDILMKNHKVVIANKYNNKKNLKEQETFKYKRARSPQFFCTNLCGGNIEECDCLYRSY